MTFLQKFSLSHKATVLFCAALACLFLYSNLMRETGTNWIVFGIQILPLLCFIPGLMSQYYRVYSWLCFVMLLYFIVAVMEVSASTATATDGLFLALVTLLFTSSMFCSRYAQRVQKNVES